MAAYVIYEGVVTDPERYEEYKVHGAKAIADAGGRYLARGGEVDAFEGQAPRDRVVILEFPTLQAAHDWYHGEQYGAARAIREGAAEARMFAVDGWDG